MFTKVCGIVSPYSNVQTCKPNIKLRHRNRFLENLRNLRIGCVCQTRFVKFQSFKASNLEGLVMTEWSLVLETEIKSGFITIMFSSQVGYKVSVA